MTIKPIEKPAPKTEVKEEKQSLIQKPIIQASQLDEKALDYEHFDDAIAGLVDPEEYAKAQRTAMEEQVVEKATSMSYSDWLEIQNKEELKHNFSYQSN